MDTGEHGMNGVSVASLVDLDLQKEEENAITQNHNLAENSVLVRILKQ